MPKKGGKRGAGGGGGGGGKQAAMNEEEWLLYMQQKARAEEEMEKKKEDMLNLFLKDKLQKEERNSRLNQNKLTEQWRGILRESRAAELRRDIEILSQTFERVLDRKDSVIQALASDLNEAQRQEARGTHAHLDVVDRLLELQKVRMVALDLRWSSSVKEVISERDEERKRLIAEHRRDCDFLEAATALTDLRYEDIYSELELEYQSSWDEVENKNLEDREALHVQMEAKMEDLWKQMQEAKASYHEATGDRLLTYETLRRRAHQSGLEIERQTRRLQSIQDAIAAFRSRVTSAQKEADGELKELRATREQVATQASRPSMQVGPARAAQRAQLAGLVSLGNAAEKKLQGVVAQGERLLRLSEVCRKLETEQEKVLPFYESSLTPEQTSASEREVAELAKATAEYPDLGRFWERHSKVALERACLELEKSQLTQENQQLRLLLRRYLDGISVSDEALRRCDQLLVVSRPALSAQAGGDAGRRHTVIEARHVLQQAL
ncbi:dynein regulatory complex subunit 2 [Denticeps clupeoides]|uniref:Dynein regulatory complex subunit 2 n=1 Tax=Denticeps clupeoides TaxID=299321 RepID=A0AAY4CI28_9TELE|nr:dynein regulatory complex subunit 2 [Denticeps clupeoides]